MTTLGSAGFLDQACLSVSATPGSRAVDWDAYLR